MLIDLTIPADLDVDTVGGKAFNLHKLLMLGLPVPPALAVHAVSSINKAKHSMLRDELMNHPVVASGTKFAVRSSGVGEDGDGNSCAGIFESYLDVDKENVFDAVERVWDSLGNARCAMYTDERSIVIDSMGVVVQHMIDADYAGVAFSMCPIEKDSKIALLEVVRGGGEALVSGAKTPATMRINRVTGMMRISRKGADDMSASLLEDIAKKILFYIENIERHYGVPVDVEWALSNGKVYILQTRPITV